MKQFLQDVELQTEQPSPHFTQPSTEDFKKWPGKHTEQESLLQVLHPEGHLTKLPELFI